MVPRSSALLLSCIYLCWAVVSSSPLSLPLSHSNQQAISSSIVNDQLVTVHHTVGRFKRANDVSLGGQSVIVTADITVGGSPFTVLLDTGSALLALPTPTCVSSRNCDSGAPNGPLPTSTIANGVPCSTTGCQQCCDGSTCATDQCAFTVTYADQTNIQGSLFRDTVSLGGLSASMVFGGISKETSGFVAPFADGIMGFSQAGSIACSPTCVTPVFDVLVQDNLTANSFGVSLDFTGGGTLTLGGVDSSLVSGSFVSTPLVGSSFYGVTFNTLSLAGSAIASDFGQTILDTGTTQILLPNAAFNALQARFQSDFCNLVGACGTQTIFAKSCLVRLTDVEAYPSLEFTFNGVQVTVPPRAYFLPTTGTNGDTVYCFGVAGWDDDMTILGYAFMRGSYIFYDRANSNISFAGAAAAATGAASTTGQTSTSAPITSAFSILFSTLFISFILFM